DRHAQSVHHCAVGVRWLRLRLGAVPRSGPVRRAAPDRDDGADDDAEHGAHHADEQHTEYVHRAHRVRSERGRQAVVRGRPTDVHLPVGGRSPTTGTVGTCCRAQERGRRMRKIFVAELEGIGEDLVAMSRAVEGAISAAGRALLERDIALAEQVIAADLEIDAMERALDERCVLVIAQQAPVAGDLRSVVSALRMSASLERMGDLARHVADIARRGYPEYGVPEELL